MALVAVPLLAAAGVPIGMHLVGQHAAQASAATAQLSAPTALKATALSSTKVQLHWQRGSGHALAETYEVFRNGAPVGTTRTTSFTDTTVRPGRSYVYVVRAKSAAGAISGKCHPAVVSTPGTGLGHKRHHSSKPHPSASQQGSATGQGPPSGFPDASNTGYQNAPGYPGQLTNCSQDIQSNTTYKFCNFPDGLNIGGGGNHPSDVTFIGCRFASNAVNDADVTDSGSGSVTFSYDTFEPNTVAAGSQPISPYATAIANDLGYQYGIDQVNPDALTIDHSDFWGFAQAVQIGYSSQSLPIDISNSWIHNPRNPEPGGDHTDGFLENYGDKGYMTFSHNTIVGDGNTNALALQGTGYTHITVTGNYFSGYGYMVNTGDNSSSSTYMTFTDNVWGSDIEPQWGPLYGSNMYQASLHGVWSGNTMYVQPGTSWMAAANSGLYWWPSDSNPDSPSQIIGHTTDWPGN